MSRVFVATETSLGRKVVIKVLPPELAAVMSADRFRREIHLAASLQHPHIVPLLAAGEAADLLYYSMPLVEGESLQARLARDGELPVPRGRADPPRPGRRLELRAPARRRPPRHQAGERAPGRQSRPRHRFRRGQGAGPGGPLIAHGDRPRARHTRVHGARAGGRRSAHRPPRGHLRARRPWVRDPVRQPAVHGTYRTGGGGRPYGAAADAARRRAPQRAARPRGGHHAQPGEAAGRSLAERG